MGATVLVTGPELVSASAVGATVERVITNAQGKFTVDHLMPGWYSLQITSPTRIPVLRNGIRVDPGQTSALEFVLGDVFAPLRFQLPRHTVSSWDDDWKWVLRTSASTRPILRYHSEIAQAAPKPPLPASQRLIGMIPGSARGDPLAGDSGVGSVLAYLRPLSKDSDLLVAGSMTANGNQASSVATAFRRNLIKGDPQELSLVLHQLSFADYVPLPSGSGQDVFPHAQGIAAGYTQTHRLLPKVTMTAGMEVNYLSATRDVVTAQPHMLLEYQLDRSTVVAVQFGTVRVEGSTAMLERVGALNSFPRVTLRDYRTKLEQLNHAELSVNRRLRRASRVEIAAYHDILHNAAVWGSAHPDDSEWLAGNFLPNPATDGIILNAGDYHSSGLRVAYSQNFGEHIEALVAYAFGDALTVPGVVQSRAQGDLQGVLRPARSAALAGKVSAQLPITHTRVSTSYEWAQRGRVTAVDPQGQANLQLQPFLGIQIRQPLPAFAFLPARIEALADFRNLLDDGNTPLSQNGHKPILLSSAYRVFRGGFSVQF
jgi:hypothetical protein